MMPVPAPVIITTDPPKLKACIAEALRVAAVLRRDLVLHPPADPATSRRAWGRVTKHWDEAQRWTEAYLRAWRAQRAGQTRRAVAS